MINQKGALTTFALRFLVLRIEKKKSDAFDGPQIRQLLRDTSFVSSMSPIEATAWTDFKNVVNDFLGNKKANNQKELVAELLSSFWDLGCYYMSIKVHYLKSHLDFFPENLGSVSDEQEKHFHQDIKVIWNAAIKGAEKYI